MYILNYRTDCGICCKCYEKQKINKNNSSTNLKPQNNIYRKISDYNVNVFEDTIKQCDDNPEIKKIVENTEKNQKYIREDEFFKKPSEEKEGNKKIITLEKKKTIDSAIENLSKNKGKRVAILNFANWIHPGGGVKGGCTQQEETICRCTSLYPNINANNVKDFYLEHRNNTNKKISNTIFNNDIIYSPDVYILKNDKDSNDIKTLNFDKNRVIDVITCAAPDNSYEELTDDDIYRIHKEKITRILDISYTKNVDIIILGAHGCGVFNNNPNSVAKAYKEVLENYKKYFDKIVIAIPILNRNSANYDSFKNILGKYITEE